MSIPVFDDERREYKKAQRREWVNAACGAGLWVWFGASLLYTFNTIPYQGQYFSQIPASCAPALCRMGTIWGGHSWVWIIISGWALYTYIFTRSWGASAVLFLFGGALHELSWNVIAFFIYGVGFTTLLEKYVGIFSFIVFCGAVVVLVLTSRMRRFIDLGRLLAILPIWGVFMYVWYTIGFPVTLYSGQTSHFLDPQTNLIEISSFTTFFAGLVGVVKKK